MSITTPVKPKQPAHVSITPLLKKLSTLPPKSRDIDAADIALAFSRVFENQLSGTQLSSLLTLLCSTGLDKHPDVIARCAASMRMAAVPVDLKKMKTTLSKRRRQRAQGTYEGGLCDIVGTGGDAHSTFNVSTASSIVASPILAMAKHGNRAQTSMSGSADVLKAITPVPPALEAVTAEHLSELYEECNYCFLLAGNYHPGMHYAATVRKELGLRTIFNLMGPLANPLEDLIEARVIGVAYQELAPIFTQALQFRGVTKAMVVCGREDMDEISCAGPTNCWWLKSTLNPKFKGDPFREDSESSTSDDDVQPKYTPSLEVFSIQPSDFGLPTHALSEVGGGKLPKENAKVLMSLLRNEMGPDHPILHFILMNVAALLVVSGVCDADTSDFGEVIRERGPGGGRWKEGVRRARHCIESGQSLRQLENFIKLSNSFA